MASKKRSKIQRERDLVKIEELRCQGKYQSEIAEILGLTQQQIGYDLKTIQKRWQEKYLTDKDAQVQEELAKINNTEREAWEAYQKSKAAAKSVIQKDKRTSGISGIEKTVKAEERVGDPRFLAEIQKAGERRAKLLGLNGPEKHEHTGKNGEPIKVENKFEGWTKEELISFATTGIKPKRN